MISIEMSATQWLASACRDSVRLVDGPAKLRQEKSARNQAPAYAYAHVRADVEAVPALVTGADAPTQPIANGGMRGPHPWRDAPVIT